MVIESLVKDGYIKFDKLLLDYMVKLGITTDEVIILNTIIKERLTVLGISKISQITSMSTIKVGEITNELIRKGYIEIVFETVNFKEKESICLKKLFCKLTNIYNDKIYIKSKKEKVIEFYKKYTHKNISHFDVQYISNWVETNIDEQKILEAMNIAKDTNKFNIKYIDGILNNKKKNIDQLAEGEGELIYEFCTEWKSRKNN